MKAAHLSRKACEQSVATGRRGSIYTCGCEAHHDHGAVLDAVRIAAGERTHAVISAQNTFTGFPWSKS